MFHPSFLFPIRSSWPQQGKGVGQNTRLTPRKTKRKLPEELACISLQSVTVKTVVFGLWGPRPVFLMLLRCTISFVCFPVNSYSRSGFVRSPCHMHHDMVELRQLGVCIPHLCASASSQFGLEQSV